MARAIDGELLELEIANIANKLAKSDAQKALMGRVMYCVEHMPTLTPPNEWVSVEERLPTDERPVLVFVGYADTMTGFITTSSYFCFDVNPHWQWDGLVRDEQRTLFWMPLPTPPGKDNNVPTKAPNEPLTLEELREMDGEPVYIIAKDMGIAEWNVITGKEPIAIAYDCPMPGFKSVVEGIAFANGRAFRAGAYGITWLAYRRPPEGEANA